MQELLVSGELLYCEEAMTLSELVPSLDLCQQLKAVGFPQDAALVWAEYESGFAYGVEARDHLDPDGDVRCDTLAAPTAGEMMKWIRAKHPDAEITSRYVWPGAAWIVRYRDDSFKNAHSDTEIAALAALVLEVAG